jgi:hypothetical protein
MDTGLTFFLMFAVALYMHFATSVIHEITNALGIHCFRFLILITIIFLCTCLYHLLVDTKFFFWQDHYEKGIVLHPWTMGISVALDCNQSQVVPVKQATFHIYLHYTWMLLPVSRLHRPLR